MIADDRVNIPMSSPISFEPDHVKRRLVRRAVGDIKSDELSSRIIAYYRENPETLHYDVINHYVRFTGSMDWPAVQAYYRAVEEMRAEHARLHGLTLRVVRSAIITHDPMAEMLLRVMREMARGMEFRVFRDLAEAEAWLDEPRDP